MLFRDSKMKQLAVVHRNVPVKDQKSLIRESTRFYFFWYFFPAENAFSTCIPTPKYAD